MPENLLMLFRSRLWRDLCGWRRTRGFSKPPTSTEAFQFLEQLMTLPHCSVMRPGAQHWNIFHQLCARSGVQGALVPDAAHAALAIETGCEWVTADTDFARFAPLLRWQHL